MHVHVHVHVRVCYREWKLTPWERCLYHNRYGGNRTGCGCGNPIIDLCLRAGYVSTVTLSYEPLNSGSWHRVHSCVGLHIELHKDEGKNVNWVNCFQFNTK